MRCSCHADHHTERVLENLPADVQFRDSLLFVLIFPFFREKQKGNNKEIILPISGFVCFKS
jgi:hypothetical protein